MNYQSLLKQAQSMQKKMMEAKSKIDSTIFEGKSELVTVNINGKREVISVKIKEDTDLNNDDKEILEDMVMIAVNNALHKIDKEIETKLGSQAGGLSGLF